ncbi:MAG TPA: multicopper oxidase domain-containing protein [Candidatus Eremiobacteraceae bacterium]|nr:multicopper oxidase domain-containing protein [Candidatus Eremiobacteraceae bacterium]
MFYRASFRISLAAFLLLSCVMPAAAQVRTYYVAADEVVWNFAPSGRDQIAQKNLPKLMPLQLGWSYRKAIYREYTDATFRHLKARPAADAYMGILGPVIHAEVGDTVRVVFKNNSRFALSVHPHGVFYSKSSEGAPYQDGVPAGDKMGESVAPGKTFTCTWAVPERAGPGPGDGSSVVWMYHSHVDEVNDVNTGPIGAIVVTARGMARPDGTPKDVDREIFALFAEYDESSSRYFASNIADPQINPRKLKPVGPLLFDDMMWTINGYSYGNMPIPQIRVGQRVRWYVLATMSDFDFHTPHWHGATVLNNGMRTDLISMTPMGMTVADMVPDNPGVWLFHCHVNVHLAGGMEARYQVIR